MGALSSAQPASANARKIYSRTPKSRSVEQNGAIVVDGKVLEGVLREEEDGRMRLG